MKLQTKVLMSIGLSLGVATTYTLRDATYQQLDALKKEIDEISAISNELITKGKKAADAGEDLSNVKVTRKAPSKFVGEYKLSPETNKKLQGLIDERLIALSKFPENQTSSIKKNITTESEGLEEWAMLKPNTSLYEIKKAMILAADDHFGSYNNDSYNTDAFFGVAETRNFLEQLKDNFSKNPEVYNQNLHRLSSAMKMRKEKAQAIKDQTNILYNTFGVEIKDTMLPTGKNLEVPYTEFIKFTKDAEILQDGTGKRVVDNADIKKQISEYPKEFVKNAFEILIKVTKDIQNTDFPGKYLAEKRLQAWNSIPLVSSTSTLAGHVKDKGDGNGEGDIDVKGSLVYLKESTDKCRDGKKVGDMFVSELNLFKCTIERFIDIVNFIITNKGIAEEVLKDKPGIVAMANDTYKVHLERAISTLTDEYKKLKDQYGKWHAHIGNCKEDYRKQNREILNNTVNTFNTLQDEAVKLEALANKAETELKIKKIDVKDAITKMTIHEQAA
ncbi:hypothetical protein IPH25_02935 [bacterium]|nr:MAG: hypothetical protein IPG37_05075 [bacterium]QQR61421.1 MAG: hypothetical protein IPH25_02935 [bacterium]QQR63058.1 MAG: hypothetical protein IPH67_01100 [bacterium]